jgi:two-component system LytT family sensor kinase
MTGLQKFMLHFMVWVFLITIFTFAATSGFNASEGIYILFLGLSLLNVLIFYVHLYAIIPITLDKRKFFIWMLSCLIVVVIFVAIKYGYMFYVYKLSGLALFAKNKK